MTTQIQSEIKEFRGEVMFEVVRRYNVYHDIEVKAENEDVAWDLIEEKAGEMGYFDVVGDRYEHLRGLDHEQDVENGYEVMEVKEVW